MDLPSGLVTFLLTDVVDSTGLWRGDPEAAGAAIGHQAEVISELVVGHGGVLPLEQGEGDSTVSVFVRPDEALRAAFAIQRRLVSEEGPRVRIGAHTGVAELVDERGYGGTAIILAARLRDVAQGGEVLVSNPTAALTAPSLPDGCVLEELGPFELKGFDEPETVHRLTHADLPPALTPRRVDVGLPGFPTTLVGREREIAEVAATVSQSPLVTVTGAGGSGKTRLAHAVAVEIGDTFDHGVTWVDLGRVTDGDLVAAAAVQACGLSDSSGEDVGRQLSRHLARHEMLVVLDNCEHLLDAVTDLVAILVSQDSAGRILTTSREPLGVAGEITWRIPSLSVPAHGVIGVDELRDHDAIQLFLERARAADSTFALDESTSVAVARVCRRLDGIPLALELAAARLRMMSVVDLADRLDDRFEVLTSGARGGIERQRTLLASVGWSYDLCDEDEQVVLRRLSVFASPFSLAAAEAVVADTVIDRLSVFEALGRLVDRSLVQHQHGRYSLLETIRAFAADRADDAGELATLRDHHLDWCLKRAGELGYPSGMGAFAGGESARATLEEGPEFRRGLDWAMARRPETVRLLTEPFAATLVTTSRGSSEAIHLARRLGEQLEPRSVEWLAAITPLAVPLTIAGYLDWVEPAQAVMAEHPDLDPALLGRLRGAFAIPLTMDGQRAGFEQVRASSELSQSVGDDWGSFVSLIHEVFWLATFGDVKGARRILAWVERQLGVGEDSWWAFQVASAAVEAFDGHHARAVELIRPALNIGVPAAAAQGAIIGGLYSDREIARSSIAAIASHSLDGPLAPIRAWTKADAGLIERDWPAARDSMSEMTARSLIPAWAIPSVARAAELDLLLDGPDAAETRIRSIAPDFFDTRHIPWSQALYLGAEGLVALARDERDVARSKALHIAQIARDTENNTLAHRGLGLLAVADGSCDEHISEASRWLGAADRYSDETGLAWSGPVLEAAVVELRSRVDEIAYEQGRALPLLDAVDQALATRPVGDRPTFGWESLTPAEVRVVDLVGEGMGNKEIAERLHVGVSTVKTHLVHAYQKLQIETRAGLAAAVASRKGA